jgi:hypothetical protein
MFKQFTESAVFIFEMGLFKYWRGSRYMMHLLIIKLVCCLGWLSGVVLGQFELGDTVSGTVNFPDLACLGNSAIFFSSFLRGRLYMEIGLKDVLAIITAPKLKKIDMSDKKIGVGLTTCPTGRIWTSSVIMLSQGMPNSSVRQFMQYIYNVHQVRSVILQCFALNSQVLTVEICTCPSSICRCIAFWTGINEVITIMLVQRMPGTIKRLADTSLCLLPCINCLINGCHGCKQGLLHAESGSAEWRMTEGTSMVDPPAAVCTTLSDISDESLATACICIPLPSAEDDRWTKLLIRSFNSKENEARGAIITHAIGSVSYDLENSMAGRAESFAKEEYNTTSLIVPRLTEIFINVLLTFWFKVDGFSSALVARRAIKDYIVDNRGRGFAAHVFITKAEVRSNANNTNNNHVCQLLSFKGNHLSP